jgi:hypothetical protein
MNKVMDTKPEDVWEATFKPFVRNWRPKWSYREHRNLQEIVYDTNVDKLQRFEKAYRQTPIAHV